MISNNELFLAKEKRRIDSYLQSADFDKARKIAEKLCRKQRNNPECWFLLGIVCVQQKNYTRAVEACRQAVRLAPHAAIAHLNLGVTLHGAGQLEEALAPLKRAIELQPDLVAGYRELGVIYNALANYSKAIKIFEELTHQVPNDSMTFLALGNLYEKLRVFDKAEQYYRTAFELDPGSAAAGTNLGNVLKALGRAEESELIYKQALEKSSKNPDIIYNLAVLYQSLYRYDEAERLYKIVIELSPSNINAKQNLGTVCITLNKIDEAIEIFSGLLLIAPDDAQLQRNLAMAQKENGELEQAKILLNRVLSNVPDDIKARQDLSLVLLQLGDFENGWKEYESRTLELDNDSTRWPFAVWNGRCSSSETVLVYPEQGIGDEVMFSSCIKDLAECVRVVLACDKRLEALFMRSFPNVKVIGRGVDDQDEWLDLLPHIDAQLSTASLPMHFRKHPSQFELASKGYLEVDPSALRKWRDRYNMLEGDVTVGISWRGGHVSNTKNKRSIDLEKWRAFFHLPNANFVNLQYDDCSAEIDLLKTQYNCRLYDWDDSNPVNDIDDFSAKIKALDLVISIDNSTVHLAGALGVKAWLLQPFCPDWRWLPGAKKSYWYASVKQYRQSTIGKWDDVMIEVCDDLSQLVANHKK